MLCIAVGIILKGPSVWDEWTKQPAHTKSAAGWASHSPTSDNRERLGHAEPSPSCVTWDHRF